MMDGIWGFLIFFFPSCWLLKKLASNNQKNRDAMRDLGVLSKIVPLLSLEESPEVILPLVSVFLFWSMFSGSRTLCCSSRNTAGQTHAQSNDVSHKKEGTNSFFFCDLVFWLQLQGSCWWSGCGHAFVGALSEFRKESRRIRAQSFGKSWRLVTFRFISFISNVEKAKNHQIRALAAVFVEQTLETDLLVFHRTSSQGLCCVVSKANLVF